LQNINFFLNTESYHIIPLVTHPWLQLVGKSCFLTETRGFSSMVLSIRQNGPT